MDKKENTSRGRIMQVVEVEEDDASKQKVDVPVPSEIMKEDLSEKTEHIPEEMEKPDIAGAFPMPEKNEKEEEKEKIEESLPTYTESKREEIHALKPEAKMDIVSELFETRGKPVEYPDISLDRKSSRFGFVIWIIILLGIVGLIGGGLLFFKQRSETIESIPSAVVTLSPTPEPTVTETPIATVSGKPKLTPTKIASPSATPKKAGLSIQILNGNGEKGVASAAKKILEEKGYTIIGTGNAANFDYVKMEIIIKADKVSFLDKLKDDLSGSYTVGNTSSDLDPTAAYDAQVIIGKE